MAMAASSSKPVTGRHVLAYLIAFFGVIISVNLTMAYLANSTWSGLIVKNGYVASQSFDKDLARSKAQDAMGWSVDVSNTSDRIRFTFTDAAGAKIEGLQITGQLERPTTDKDDQPVTFSSIGAGVYSAPAKLSPGVWEIEIEAKGKDDLAYRKIFRFMVQG
jgi:nitrogen fixation protein FixH